MNTGTNKVQNALESTMTRNEIDSQAAALRYIHDSYIAERENSGEGQYSKLWQSLIALANDPTNEVINYSPSSCSEIYESGLLARQKAFIVNTRNLNSTNDDASGAIIPYLRYPDLFAQAVVYPRLFFAEEDEAVLSQAAGKTISGVEGVYIVAVKDASGTYVVDNGAVNGNGMGYYDFYIRTCFDVIGAKEPNAISTVIRLYNPDVATTDYSKSDFVLVYQDGESMVKAETKKEIAKNVEFDVAGPVDGAFAWSTNGTCGARLYGPSYEKRISIGIGTTIIYAVRKCDYNLTYNANGGTNAPETQKQSDGPATTFTITEDKPVRDGYSFEGWAETSSSAKKYNSGDKISLTAPTINKTLYAVWKENPKYKLAISSSNVNVTVTRTEGYSTGNLSNGASLYDGDKLTIECKAKSGYYLMSCSTGGYENGTAVASDVNVSASAVSNSTQYYLDVNFEINGTSWCGSESGWGSYGHCPLSSSNGVYVTINGKRYGSGTCGDYYTMWNVGTKFKVTVNSIASRYKYLGYIYNGVSGTSKTIEGVVDGRSGVTLRFSF